MRSYGTPRELSYESFIESFGKEPVDKLFVDYKGENKRRSMFARPKEMASTLLKTQGLKLTNGQEDTNNNSVEQSDCTTTSQKETRTERMSRRLRKISLRKKDSSKSTTENKKTTNPLHRSKSVSFLGIAPTATNWLTSFNASIHQRALRKCSVPVPDVSATPMSKITSAAHRGYLSIKHQKKQTWTRFWCILQDSSLYCYSSKDVEFADDILALGGYAVTKTNGSNIFLERPGKDMYECKGDDEAAQEKWVDAFVHNISSVKRSVTKLQRSISSVQTSPRKKKLPPVYERSVSDMSLDVARVKAKLLEEVLAQQREIMQEQQRLQKLSSPKERQPQSPVERQKVKIGSISSLEQSEDHGYCSSLDGSMNDSFSENGDSRHNSPTSRSYRSMSTVSVASTASLMSIPEERRKSTEVCPKVLAEIEEFRTFSQQTLKRKQSSVANQVSS